MKNNIKPGVTAEPQMSNWLKCWIVLHTIVFIPFTLVGWVARMVVAFAQAGWDAAGDFLDGAGE